MIKRILLLLLLMASGTWAQGIAYNQPAFANIQGIPRILATVPVTVCSDGATGIPCSPATTIYSDEALTHLVTQPGFSTDANGNIQFFVSTNGNYVISVGASALAPGAVNYVITLGGGSTFPSTGTQIGPSNPAIPAFGNPPASSVGLTIMSSTGAKLPVYLYNYSAVLGDTIYSGVAITYTVGTANSWGWNTNAYANPGVGQTVPTSANSNGFNASIASNYGYTANAGVGIVTLAGAFAGLTENLSTGTITHGAGFYAQDNVNQAGGTLTNAEGVYFAKQTDGTNNYGAYFEDFGTGSNNFAINVLGGKSKFGGPIVAAGAQPSIGGTGACSTVTTLTGGQWAGTFKCTGTTGASTVTISFANTLSNGYNCSASDETTANTIRQSFHTGTVCTLSGTVNANDVIVWSAAGF